MRFFSTSSRRSFCRSFAGLVLAYFLDPVADRLERLGLSRLLATVLILVLFIVTFVLLLIILLPVLASQMSDLIARLPGYVTLLQELIATRNAEWLKDFIGVDASVIRNSLDLLLQQGAGFLTTLLQSIWSSGKTLINVAALFVVTPVVTFTCCSIGTAWSPRLTTSFRANTSTPFVKSPAI